METDDFESDVEGEEMLRDFMRQYPWFEGFKDRNSNSGSEATPGDVTMHHAPQIEPAVWAQDIARIAVRLLRNDQKKADVVSQWSGAAVFRPDAFVKVYVKLVGFGFVLALALIAVTIGAFRLGQAL